MSENPSWHIYGSGIARKFAQDRAKLVPDSPYARLAKEGQEFKSNLDGWVPGFFKPVKRGCFLNAQYAVMNRINLRYFEGLAANGINTAVEHAWVINENNEVLDCTPGYRFIKDYFGMQFSRFDILALFEKEGAYGNSILFAPPKHEP